MDRRQVEYFVAVAEHGGFGRAAAVLEVAQPTLAQSVKALERELGAELFHRVQRGVVLSAAGQAFLGPARRLLRGLSAARAAVSAGRAETSLDLVTVRVLAAHPGASLAGSFCRDHPEVLIRLDEAVGEDTVPLMIRTGSAELGLTHLPVPPDGLEIVELGTQELMAVFPPGTDPGTAGSLPLTALHGVDVVGFPDGGWRDIVERALSRAGVRTRVAVELATLDMVVPLVLGGAGATFLPAELAWAAAARGAVVRALLPALRQPFGLIHASRPLRPAAAAFVRHAQAEWDCG